MTDVRALFPARRWMRASPGFRKTAYAGGATNSKGHFLNSSA